MQRTVMSFDQDEEGHWRALLECGHAFHVRHNPPWQVREWVLTEEGRQDWLGTLKECKLCDQAEARLSGGN